MPTSRPVPVASPVGTWGTGAEHEPRIGISDDGRLGGHDGCNSFGTTWRAAGESGLIIETGQWGSTMRYCGWEWFPAARSATIDGDVMTVHDASGTILGSLARQESDTRS